MSTSSSSSLRSSSTSTTNKSARELFSSLKEKAASQSSLLRKQSSSWFSKQEDVVPSLPLPEITFPFPVMEQPSRVLLKSLNRGHVDEQYALSSTKKGEVVASSKRGEREQFLLIPVEETSEDQDGGDVNASRVKRKDMFYLKSYKFNRYLSSIYSDNITTVDFTDKNEDWKDQTLGLSEQWVLMSSHHGGHFLISAQNELNLACYKSDTTLEVGLKCDNDVSESWEVEFVSGELCFMSSSCNQQQIRCDLVGKLGLTNDRRGWEVWHFVESGGGKVRIVSWMHPFCIICNHDGQVSTSAVGKAELDCDEWTVEKAPDGYSGVLIKSVVCARRILCCGDDGFMTTETLESENGVWKLDAAHSQTYTLASVHHGRSVGPFPLVSDNAKESDAIILQQLDKQGTVRLYHKARGEYLQSSKDREVVCTDMPLNENRALWKMEPRPDGGYTFTSMSDNTLLSFSCDEEAPKLCTVTDISDEKREVWCINPILPRAVSSDKIKTFALGTSIAVGTTVAMPFLMAGMVAVLPAEATLAASILSVGLTSAEAAASVGAIGATAYIVFREDGDTLGMDVKDEEEGDTKLYTKRPLCSWGSW